MRFKLVAKDNKFGLEIKMEFDDFEELDNFVRFYRLDIVRVIDCKTGMVINGY